MSQSRCKMLCAKELIDVAKSRQLQRIKSAKQRELREAYEVCRAENSYACFPLFSRLRIKSRKQVLMEHVVSGAVEPAAAMILLCSWGSIFLEQLKNATKHIFLRWLIGKEIARLCKAHPTMTI